jgi:hypothetical protein
LGLGNEGLGFGFGFGLGLGYGLGVGFIFRFNFIGNIFQSVISEKAGNFLFVHNHRLLVQGAKFVHADGRQSVNLFGKRENFRFDVDSVDGYKSVNILSVDGYERVDIFRVDSIFNR